MVTRKQIFVGLGFTLTTIAIYLFIQFQRLKNFTLKVRGINIKKATKDEVNFDITFDFVNKSDLQIALAYQEYNVFLNGNPITSVRSDGMQIILPKTSTKLSANVSFSPAKIAKGLDLTKLLGFIVNFKNQRLKIETKLGVRYMNYTIPITSVTEDIIANWIPKK